MLKDQINLQLALIEYSKNKALQHIIKAFVSGPIQCGYKMNYNLTNRIGVHPEMIILLVELFKKEGLAQWI